MKIATIDDLEFVDMVFKHEAVWPFMSEDGADLQNFTARPLLDHPNCIVLIPNQWSVFVATPINRTTFDCHQNVLPEGRGKAAMTAGQHCIDWVFKNTSYSKLMGWIPFFNRPAYALAIRLGFWVEGIARKSFTKNAKLYDQWLVGLAKGERKWA